MVRQNYKRLQKEEKKKMEIRSLDIEREKRKKKKWNGGMSEKVRMKKEI